MTREEQYLAKIAGEETDIPNKPILRSEQYLAKIAGEDVEIPEKPLHDEETYLAILTGESYDVPMPYNRIEQYMAKACGLEIEVPTPITRMEQLWAKIAEGGSWTVTEITGTLPLTFLSKGDDLIDYRIYGTSMGAGVETESGEPAGYKLPLTVESGAQSQDIPIYIGSTKLGEEEYVDYGEQKVWKRTEIKGLSEPLCGISDRNDTLDLSTGTLTRRIKRLVLTGTDADGEMSVTAQGIVYTTPIPTLKNVGSAFCTHFKYINQSQSSNMPDNSFTTRGGAGRSLWFKTDFTTVADFQSYLATQYASGTPVTVWYVLVDSETSTIPVPSGLTGTIEGYLIQDGTPTPETPIYPTANGVKQPDGTYTIQSAYLRPTDPPVSLPAILTYQGENTLSSTETLGEVEITGKIKEAVPNG
jgi:hypothetical protein